MTVRAFECRPPGNAKTLGFVALTAVEALAPGTRIVRVRVGSQWLCALLDRSRVVEVEGMLLRDAVASDEQDCPECASQPPAAPPPAAPDVAALPAVSTAARQVQAAAISLQGLRLVVVLVARELIASPGEAEMVAADLRPRFGGVEVVLMGQDDDGTPHFHGATHLVRQVAELPIDRMPWKAYAVA